MLDTVLAADWFSRRPTGRPGPGPRHRPGPVEVGRASAIDLHVPLREIGVVGCLRVSEGGDEVLITGDSAAVLDGCRAVAVDDAGTWCARRGVDDLLQHEHVLPVVAEVVD